MTEYSANKLLEDIKPIVDRYRNDYLKQGKEFNIFHVEHIASDEVRVCRLIRELLDPSGSHGQGDFFLRRFVELVLKLKGCFTDKEFQNARVTQEERTDYARRVDIVIRIGKRVFPIEVKIYAADQAGQCADYYNHVRDKDPDAKIYYLTLDGHQPSNDSKADLQPDQYVCLSFSDDILTWLDNCLEASELDKVYPVKEILSQFRDVIRVLTGRREDAMTMEIKDIIKSSYENMRAATKIPNAVLAAKADKMRDVFDGIKKHMADLNLKFTDVVDSYQAEADMYYRSPQMTWPSINYILSVPDESIEGKIALRFEIGEYLYCGIVPWFGTNNYEGSKSEQIAAYINENLKPDSIPLSVTEKYWYWWKYLDEGCRVNFRRDEDDKYLQLFDEGTFEDYMKNVCGVINSVLENIGVI